MPASAVGGHDAADILRGGAGAEALIICGDPCRIRMDYVVCPSQDVDCDCWDRPAGESKMRCDVVMHASYFSMHSAPKQDVDLMVRNEGRAGPAPCSCCFVLAGRCMFFWRGESSFSNLKLSNSHVRSS